MELFSCYQLNYIPRLVVHWQVVYGDFSQSFHWQQMPAATTDVALRAVRVNRNCKVVGLMATNELKLSIELCEAERSRPYATMFSSTFIQNVSMVLLCRKNLCGMLLVKWRNFASADNKLLLYNWRWWCVFSTDDFLIGKDFRNILFHKFQLVWRDLACL